MYCVILRNGSYSTEGDRQHGLHASVLHRPDHAFLVHQRTSDQSPELDVFDSHRHKLGVGVRSELHHEDPLSMATFTSHSGACPRGQRSLSQWILICGIFTVNSVLYK